MESLLQMSEGTLVQHIPSALYFVVVKVNLGYEEVLLRQVIDPNRSEEELDDPYWEIVSEYGLHSFKQML